MSAIERLLERLEGVRRTGAGKWRARCPAHGSRGLTLAIAERDDRVLIRCHAECETEAVMRAVGLQMSDLYEKPLNHSLERIRRPWSASDVLDIALQEVSVAAIVINDIAERRSVTAIDLNRLLTAGARLTSLNQLVKG
jgi:hypothetical protein